MPGFIINQDRANQSVGNGVKPVNKITTYENLDKMWDQPPFTIVVPPDIILLEED